MYSFPDMEPVCYSMFNSNCCFLTCIQISQEAGKVVCYSHFFKNFPQFVVIHTVKDFGIVNKAEIDVFLEPSLLFNMLSKFVLELPDVEAGFRKGRGTRDQIANIHWIMEKEREFQKNIYFCFIDYAKAFDCVDHNKLWKILKEMGIPDHLTCLLRNCMQVRKQQLELDMEKQTGSKFGKDYIKVVYCHPVYLAYMQST